MAERNAGTLETKRILYRIGVNLGDVLIEATTFWAMASTSRPGWRAFCEPGGVLISGTSYDHVRGKIDAHFVDLGEQGDLKKRRATGAGLCAQYWLGNLADRVLRHRAGKKRAATPLDRRPAVRQHRRRP